MLVLLLPIAVALVGVCAYLVVSTAASMAASMAAPSARVGRWLALWIAAWAEIVLTVEVLSLLDAITPLAFIVCYVVFAAAAVAIWVRRGRPTMRLLTLPSRGQIGAAARGHPVLAVLLVVLAICALANLLVAVAVPVNNHDAMSYHLPRVGYWIQHGSTDHYDTHNERQNFAPPNAEFAYLSAIIFARAEWPAPLAQYAAYFACIAAVYAIARELGATNAASLFAALLLGTMTEILLEATVPKNGLIVSSFLACAVVFALAGLRVIPSAVTQNAPAPGRDKKKDTKRRKGAKERARPVPAPEAITTPPTAGLRALVWSALAVGLAVGTKITALAFLPGLAIGAAIIAMTGGARDWPRRVAIWAGCSVCAVVFLGAFNYVRNYLDYDGSIGGPPQTAQQVRLERVTPRALVSNLARYGYHLCDFSALWPRGLARGLTELRAVAAPKLFGALAIVVNAPDLNLGGPEAQFPVDDQTGRFDEFPRLHEDRAWYGPIAFFVGLPLVLVHLVHSPIRKQWARFAVALMPVLYWLIICATLRYQIWGGRFFSTAAVAGAPLLSLAYVPRFRSVLKHGVRWLLVVAAASTALTATFYNSSKPILPRIYSDDALDTPQAPTSVLSLRPMSVRGRFYWEGPLVAGLPDEDFPQRMKLGVVLGGDDCDWFLFLPRLRRTIVPLPPDSERVARAFRDGEVDMVVISKAEAERTKMGPILGERSLITLLNPNEKLDRALTVAWSFVFAREGDNDVLFPTRDWSLISEPEEVRQQTALENGFWLKPDQCFLPVRELPEGVVWMRMEPLRNLLSDGPLVFHFSVGGRKVHELTVDSPGARDVVIPWQPGAGTAGQVLRIEVTSPAERVSAHLSRGDVPTYKLLTPPIWEQAGGPTR